jgi:hypothetical protein
MGKGKVHYIEVVYDEEDVSEDEVAHTHDSGKRSSEAKPPHLDIFEDKSLQEGFKKVTIATLSGVPRYYTFKIKGVFQGQGVTTLIDGGATHNFIYMALVARRHIPNEEFKGFNVGVAYGYNMTCT